MVEAAPVSPNLKAKTSIRSQSNPKRPPLLPSERDNTASLNLRRPKSREVNSRYLSTSSSTTSTTTTTSGSSSSTFSNSSQFSSLRRCPSPIPGRTLAKAPATPNSLCSSSLRRSPSPIPTNSAAAKRSQSAERRRPAREMSAAAKLLVSSSISSTRSLSVSFQGQSIAVPKTPAGLRRGTPERRLTSSSAPTVTTPTLRKATPERRLTSSETPATATTSLRKATPERKLTSAPVSTPRKGGGTSARPFELHQPWPGRSRPGSISMNRSVDLFSEGKKLVNGSGNVVRALQGSLTRTSSCEDQTRRSSESLVSVTDSLVSECNSGSQDSNSSAMRSKCGNRCIVVPARFWHETNSRLRNGSDPGSPMSRNGVLRGPVPQKLVCNSPGASPRGSVSCRGFTSPIRGAVRPSSPSKLVSSVGMERCSPSRRMISPLRGRNGASSVVSFGADVRRIKVGDCRLGDAHFLRLLHNRHLQWRFANARAEALLCSQKIYVERNLYNAWKKASDLRGAVSSKRKELQWLRQKLNLVSILKGQMLYLEEWALMDQDHCSSLSKAAESLRTSIIRLPVVGGAKADIQDMKDAICSAADVMQAMASSICSLLSKVEEANLLVAEVAGMTLKEHSLLSECKVILSALAAMQVKDCSLRAHLLQLKFAPSNMAVKA